MASRSSPGGGRSRAPIEASAGWRDGTAARASSPRSRRSRARKVVGRAADAALGDDGGDQLAGRHVESGVEDGRGRGGGQAPGDTADLGGVPLLDDDGGAR